MARLSDDPELAAHLRRLADETSVPYTTLTAWADQPAPSGIDPDLWAAAGRDRIINGTAWTPEQLDALRRQVTATRTTAADQAA